MCDLRNKPVINICDCKILGYVADIDFDICTGHICSIIVPGPGKLCGLFGRDTEFVIPFQCVRGMGPDAILVDVCVDKITCKCD